MKKRRRDNRGSLVHEMWKLFGYVSRRRQRQMGLLLILMVVSALCEVVSLGAVLPFLGALSHAEQLLSDPKLQPLIILFQIRTPTQLVMALALGFILAVFLANGLRVLTIHVQTHLAADISSDISCELYQKTLLQPYSFHVQHNSSDLLNSVTVDTRLLTMQVLIPALAFLTNSCIGLALAGGLFLIDGRVAMTAIAILSSFYIIIYRLRSNLLKRNSRVIVQRSHQQIKVVQEGLGGIRDILMDGTHGFFESAYGEADKPYRHALASNRVISMTPRYIIEGLMMTVVALLALSLGRQGDFSRAVPVLGGLVLGANRLLPTLQKSFVAAAKMQGARVSLQRILVGLQRTADPIQMWVPSQGLELKQELRFENVWFRYSDKTDWVLKDLNLSIEVKTTVGFVGSTGSGKSTTTDLILGLLKPQKGTIWVDDQPLEGERLRQWQQSVAHVPQSIFLSDTTIAENIAFGIPREILDFEKVCKVAQLAQIDEFIQGLPAQYDTYVGERGVRLSGGQRQRIGIARALYRQASIIVFDEATSALDNTTEKEVMAAIYGLSHQFTLILIAHRLSTVEKCDCIFQLDQGQIAHSGTFKELY